MFILLHRFQSLPDCLKCSGVSRRYNPLRLSNIYSHQNPAPFHTVACRVISAKGFRLGHLDVAQPSWMARVIAALSGPSRMPRSENQCAMPPGRVRELFTFVGPIALGCQPQKLALNMWTKL